MNNSIPGPKGHFLIGNLPELQRDRLSFLLELAQIYGDVVQLKIGPATYVIICHPDGVQHVLQDNHPNYSKDTPAFASLKPLLGNGLLLSNGDFWLRQRRLMQPAFHRQQINSFAELMVGETQSMLDGWDKTIKSGEVINIQQEMMRLTLAIVTRALFGSKVSDPDGSIGQNITFLLEDAIFRFDHPFYPPIWFPTRQNRNFSASRSELDQVIYDLIAQRRSGENDSHDLLSMLMQAQDENSNDGMSDRQLRDEVITLFLAGHETTAVALTWTLYLLSTHPQVERRLGSELDDVLAGRTPSLDDLPRLTYTRAVLDESMRLYPPAWVTERKALQDDMIGPYRIPAGTTLIISPYITHRHPAFWSDPEDFDPLRFEPQQAADRPRYAFFPFGGGPRQCIGNSFALLEAQLVLALLLQQRRFELAPGWEVVPEPLITLRPKGGMRMVIEEQNTHPGDSHTGLPLDYRH